ncbi:hypothetical protein [Winogradskyella sp. Asnod2-B02-A]|uniref:hypothetical protein n=1 Tax=Winogradskyella sp. Asnod2-B02-A TaxID=3160583 RepID=UPI00386982E5
MKITKLLLIFTIVLISCTNDSNNSEESNNNSNFQEPEYVMLIPEATPISSIVLDDNIQIVYAESNFTYKISQVNSNGFIEWTRDLELLDDFIEFSLFKKIGSVLYFIYQQNDGLKFIELDINGSVTNNGVISNTRYNRLQANSDKFYAMKYESNNVIINSYTYTGNFIETNNITTNIYATHNCKVLIKNDLSYVFGQENFIANNPFFYENFYCEIYNSSLELLGDFNINLSNKIGNEQLALVLNNGNILTKNYNGNINKTQIEIFDSNGNLLFDNSFNERHGASRILEDNNGNLRLILKNASAIPNEKNMRLITLTQNLEVVSERRLGSDSDVGDNVKEIIETNEFIYLIGGTAGTDGDFDIPNNSHTDDLFIFKLEK